MKLNGQIFKKYAKAIRKLGVIWALGIAGLIAVGCQLSTVEQPPEHFEGQRAFELVANQVDFGPRHPGSDGHSQIQGWIEQNLRELGWQVQRQNFNHNGVDLSNLIGRNNYTGRPLYILGAHYDTRPVADQEQHEFPGPVIGANDGASGVAVLLELARVLPQDLMACQLQLAFFDAEDSGGLDDWEWILGSRYMAANLEERPTGVIIVDMVGDNDLNLPKERNSDPTLQAEIWDVANSLGYIAFEERPGYSILDDHTPFLELGIPAVDIIDFDYPYWHTEADTLDKVSAASLEMVGRTLQAWLMDTCLTSATN